MKGYFLRRLLLIPLTFLGITMMVFAVTRFVPGGPVEQLIAERKQAEEGGGGGKGGHEGGSELGQNTSLSPEQMQELRHYYGFDRPWYIGYVEWLGRVCSFDLGTSYQFNEPVWDLIRARFPVSLFYGLTTLFITYAVCIPLGVFKAVRHRSAVDTFSSVVVFIGHALPGYILAVLMMVFLAARWRWFPMGGFTGQNFSDLSVFGKIGDVFYHAALPLICYLIGSFASLTFLIKNQLLDNLATDYMRTAIAKGVPYQKAVIRHALRNSIIPLASGFGGLLGILLTGSFLVEKIFDIDGMGLLGYNAAVGRDYPLMMGTLVISCLALLLGNIVSDIAVALVDPRIKFK